MENNIYIFAIVFIPFLAAILNLLLSGYNRAQRWVGLVAGILTWGSSVIVLLEVIAFGPQTYRLGDYVPPFGIVLVADLMAAIFTVMGTTVMMAGLIYLVHSREYCVRFPAFVSLFLFMEVGLNGSFLTGDLFTFFVFIELMVLSSVAAVAVSDDQFGLEAAIKYVFISGMGTLFLLLGIGAMYTTFGTLNLAHMGLLLATEGRPLLAQSAGVMLVAAFLLKSAVFPFHFWQPDFHTTAPTAVHGVLSSVVVKVGIYMVIRVMTLLFTEEADLLQNLLLLLGIIGIFFGSFGALRTYNGKRMLAYSTIGQVGFILVALGWGTPLALTAAIIYIFNHAFIKSALLMTMGAVASYSAEHSVDFKDLRGAGREMPAILSVLWFLGAMSLAGLPPLNGFISKLSIVRGGVDAGTWLTLGLAVASGMLTLTYMFRAWQYIFQTKNPDLKLTILKEGDGWLAPALLIGICILLGFYARPLIVLAEQAVINISNPEIYINAVNLFN